MLRRIVEQIEELHAASAEQSDERRSDSPQKQAVESTLANCLQQLRAIVAADALDKVLRRPALRIF